MKAKPKSDVLTNKQLDDQKLIDDYVSLDVAEKQVKAAKEELRKQVLQRFGVGTYAGTKGVLEISVSNMNQYDTEKAKKLLGRNFLQCVSLSITKAEAFLTKAQIQTLITGTTEVLKIKAKEIK